MGGRLYTARSNMIAVSQELQNQAATMRLADTMKNSTAVMQQVNQLVNVPEMHETMEVLAKEMMRAGLIDEVIQEGMEDMDDDEMEENVAKEVDRVLEAMAIDSAVRMQVAGPDTAVAAAVAAQPAAASVATPQPAAAAIG